MTALWSYDDEPRRGDPLLPGAAPAAIRDALLPEDRSEFDAAYERSLAVARERLDLGELFRALEHWRRVALLQRDRDGYRALVRRAAELLTGEPVPDDEPLDVTRARAGMQVSYRVEEDERAQAQVEALPGAALSAYAEVRVVLEIAPWSGDSINRRNPNGAVRTATFGSAGQGMVTYLVLEDIRRVDVLDVVWLS